MVGITLYGNVMGNKYNNTAKKEIMLKFDQFRFCKQEVSKCLDRSDGFGSQWDVEVVCISPENL